MAKFITEKDQFIWELLKDPNYKVLRGGRVMTRVAPGCRTTTGPWRRAGWVSESRAGTKNYWRLKYKGVQLYCNRIVFARFHGSLDPSLVVDHKDHDTLNDAFDNLQQITPSKNRKRAWDLCRFHGRTAAEIRADWKKGIQIGLKHNWRGRA